MSDDPNGSPSPADPAPTPAPDPNAAPVAPADPASNPAPAGDPAPKDPAPADEPFSVKAPEGAEEYQADIDKFSGDMVSWLKANPNASGYEILEEVVARQVKLMGEVKSQAMAQRNQQISTWEEELKADKDFGGEAFDKNVATAIKGLEAVGSPELRQMLDQTGLGSHPEIVRAFKKVGELVADAPFATGAQPAQSASPAARMYPNMRQ